MLLLRFFLLALLLNMVSGISDSHSATPQCSSESRITETFDNGAVWDFCWESRVRENLVLTDVYYTPPNGEPSREPFRVLGSGRLSQLHVAYDDSDVTYNDVTQFGLGSGYLLTLDEADCPGGELLEIQTRPALCKTRTTADTGYRTASRSNKTQSLNIFSASQVGAYAYILSWTFYADGAIKPELGATGALQRNSQNVEEPFGRLLRGDTENVWLSHTHNYYWRLDVDLGDSAADDTISELRYEPLKDGTRKQHRELFTIEQARQINPEQQTAWLIGENTEQDSKAYIIEPLRYGHRFERKDVEPYTDFDFFVTVAKDCERFASQNSRFNPDCLNDVMEFVDEQPIENQDIVIWHRVAFHHVPRSEDQRHMHTHWDGFLMASQNVLTSTNSLPQEANTAPEFAELEGRTNHAGDDIHDRFLATDADGDILSYTGEGLPPGLSLTGRGQLFGKASTAGVFNVSITARDEVSQATQSFQWAVLSSTSETKFTGSLGLLSGLLLLWLAIRRVEQ